MNIKFVSWEVSLIKISALIPQKVSFDEEFLKNHPVFNMINHPFEEDIRFNIYIMSKIEMRKINNKNNNVKLNVLSKK